MLVLQEVFSISIPEVSREASIFSISIPEVFQGTSVFSISIQKVLREAAAVYRFRYALIQGEVPADSLASFINAQIYPAFRFRANSNT